MNNMNAECWTEVKKNYSVKLFCMCMGFFFFFFLILPRSQTDHEIEKRRCFIMPRTSSKVDLSFQTIVAFLSSSGSGMEYVFYEL